MRNNPLDDIVKCDIEISSPSSSDATFDTILLVVPGPIASGTQTISGVTAIGKADELLDYGFTTESAVYIAATVAFSQNPSPDKLLFVVRGKVDTDGNYYEASTQTAAGAKKIVENTATPASNEIKLEDVTPVYPSTFTPAVGGYVVQTQESAGTYDPIADTLAYANAQASFYGIHLTSFKDAADVRAAITWAESNEKVFAFEYTDIDSCPVQNFSYYRSFGMFSGIADGYEASEQPVENGYAALAWMAKCFGYDPGTETWNLKELATIVPSKLSSSQKQALSNIKINQFLRYAGCNCAIGGNMLSGEWIDVIRFRDWLKNELQLRVFNALKVNRKVPFTDGGIGLIEGTMVATLKDGQDIGGIAPTEYDADDNPIYGYTVTVPKASDLTEAERRSRKLTGCKWSARLAGAIHMVEIGGNLTF